MTKYISVLLLSTICAFTLLMGVKFSNVVSQTPLQDVQKNKNTTVTYMVYGDNGEIELLYSYPAYQADR